MTQALSGFITPGKKLEPAIQQQVIADFHRDGYAIIRNVLTADEIATLREISDRLLDDPALAKDHVTYAITTQVLRASQALDVAFCDMLVREPFISLAEMIVGSNVAFCGQTVLRSGNGKGVTVWHVDDILEFPLPPEVPGHDRRAQMPVFWFSFQIALSDIDGIEHGPTEVVPGSHRSGQQPPAEEANRVFDGKGATPILCKAGDIYLFNHQLWHRGAPNQSDRVRYLMQNQYCRAWGPYRFNSIDGIKRLPADQLANASPRLKKLLERHRTSGW